MPEPPISFLSPEDVGERSVFFSRLRGNHAARQGLGPTARLGDAADEAARLRDLAETLRLALIGIFEAGEYTITDRRGLSCNGWPFPAELAGHIGAALAELACELDNVDVPGTQTGG